MTHDCNIGVEDIDRHRACLVRCPDCGQMEIWSRDEYLDHGFCRTAPAAVMTDEGTCPVCGEELIAPRTEESCS